MDSDSSDDDYMMVRKRLRTRPSAEAYVATANRYSLDFDFEKVCSVTLSNQNVYACLVCGKYLQGRGKGTPAYTHSMEHNHHIFIHLSDASFWCVPDNCEVTDKTLEDIKSNLFPTFSDPTTLQLPMSALSLTGSEFFPGLVGLNQIKADSYLNAVVHSLCAVVPLRNHFLLLKRAENELAVAFAELMRKICNPQSFKGITSPHEFLQQVGLSSKNEFFASSSDPFKFLEWLLPSLGESVIRKTFQGLAQSGPFMHLSLDLPVMPVFKSEKEFIPTTALSDLLAQRFHEDKITKMPEFMIVHFKRFVMNNFFLEKNSTIVRFPLTGLDLAPLSASSDASSGTYSLVSTVCHEGKPEGGNYKAYVLHPVSNQWFECDALRVKKIIPQSVAVVESYIQIWRLDQPLSH
jgi:U4/U6.U5 tri-snRNP-associated protein 2